jgi:hypothetical protein
LKFFRDKHLQRADCSHKFLCLSTPVPASKKANPEILSDLSQRGASHVQLSSHPFQGTADIPPVYRSCLSSTDLIDTRVLTLHPPSDNLSFRDAGVHL